MSVRAADLLAQTLDGGALDLGESPRRAMRPSIVPQ